MRFPSLSNAGSRLQTKALKALLEKSPPRFFEGQSDKKLLRAFKRASEHSPGYSRHLARCGVDPGKVTSPERFREIVPIVDKDVVFSNPSQLREWCIGGSLRDVSAAWSSSGHSGRFSYGVETFSEQKRSGAMIEFFLELLFGAVSRRTVVINCTPMGVRLPALRIPVADTSVRSDVVLALIEALAPEFEQFVLVGEAMFLKKVAEEGVDSGLNWDGVRVNLVAGAEFVPESYRRYMAKLLLIDLDDPSDAKIYVNMGLSELGLSIFFENESMVEIRRSADRDAQVRHGLCGSDEPVCPEFFQYVPTNFYLESQPWPDGTDRLIVTTLDEAHLLPLIRYRTGDRVRLFRYDEFCSSLEALGLGRCAPKLRLPVALVWGRGVRVGASADKALTPEEVKAAVFDEHQVANALTGNFTLREAAEGDVNLHLQLRPGKRAGEIGEVLKNRLDQTGARRLRLEVIPYERFEAGMELNYERKFNYTPK